jgi:hypothetical protein
MARKCAALAALALAGLIAPAAASADPAQQANVPVSFTSWSRCPDDGSGEQVAWEGTMHVGYVFTTMPEGGYRELFHANIHMEGMGLTTGDRYVANGAFSLGGTYPPAGMAIVTDIEHVHSLHAGETMPDDDYTSVILLTPNGNFIEQEGCS